MIRRSFISIIFVLIYIGCAAKPTSPTPEELAKLDYGDPPTVDYKAVIKNYFEEVLFDPFSAHYKFCNKPKKVWVKEPPLMGGRLLAGYIVFVRVNAKNRFGGYVGWRTYGFLFKDNKIIRVFDYIEVWGIWKYKNCPEGVNKSIQHPNPY